MVSDTVNRQLPPAKRKPPAAGRGRKFGELNKNTKILKDAIILAAEAHGKDGQGKDGLMGYLAMVAETDTKSFVSLLGRVLPLQIQATVAHEHTTKEQRDAAAEAFIRSREDEQRIVN